MGRNGRTPPASLVCLYADELVERDDGSGGGFEVPGRAVTVKSKPLAALVCAVSLWSLEQEGAVRLSLEEKRWLGIPTRKVLVEPVSRDALLSPRPPGLASDLAGVVATSGAQDAGDLVQAWLGHDTADPHGTVVARALAEGLASSTLSEASAGRSRVADLVRGRTRLVRRAEEEADRQGEFWAFLESWRAFETSRAYLADALVAACRSGLDLRVARGADD